MAKINRGDRGNSENLRHQFVDLVEYKNVPTYINSLATQTEDMKLKQVLSIYSYAWNTLFKTTNFCKANEVSNTKYLDQGYFN